jgi:endonuclease YncB( thermonuclease family)
MKPQFLRRLGAAAIGLVLLAPGAGLAQSADTISGPATAVGPDIILVNNTRVILLGIDAPEANQTCDEAGAKLWNCGDSALAVLSQTLNQGDVTCTLKGNPDPLARRSGTCKIGDQDVADVLVKQGLALPYPKDPESKNYEADAAAAKAARQGMFADGVSFMNPWEFRIKHNHSPLK